MSQEKVDKYKASKKNRKEEVSKKKQQDKLRKMLYTALGVIVACAVVLALIFTGINSVKEKNDHQKTAYQAQDYVVPDMAGLQNSEAEE